MGDVRGRGVCKWWRDAGAASVAQQGGRGRSGRKYVSQSCRVWRAAPGVLSFMGILEGEARGSSRRRVVGRADERLRRVGAMDDLSAPVQLGVTCGCAPARSLRGAGDAARMPWVRHVSCLGGRASSPLGVQQLQLLLGPRVHGRCRCARQDESCGCGCRMAVPCGRAMLCGA